VITDSRLDLLLSTFPKPPKANPIEALTDAADALADMGPSISPGEVRLILGGLASSWAITVDPSHFDRLGEWTSQLAASRARIGENGDDLQAHLADQAAGRYAMVSWPWPVLTRESRSLMPGSVTIVCGTPGASKSWFALSCIRHWTANGVKSGVLMLEETRKWHLQRGLAQCAGDPKLLYPEWIAANRDKANAIWLAHRDELNILGQHITCDGDMTLAGCADYVETQCEAGCRVIIIDPISLADPGSERAWEADRKFMARTKVAIEKHGVSLVLVTHPKKGNGKNGPPTLDDLAGGAAYGRACASALWVSGVDAPEEMPIINEYGEYRMGVPQKVIRILKARNSVGTNKRIAYTFDDLRFEELGEIAGNKQPKPAQGPRLRSRPSEDEDAFKDNA